MEYYAARAYGLRRKERTSFARLIAEAPSDGNPEETIILQKLSIEYGEQKATELVADALAAGVLYYENGLYRVPVPSMSDWFLENYLPEKGSYPAKSASPEQV